MTIQHTPGPWTTQQSSRTEIYIVANSAEVKNKWVATSCNHEFHPTEEENERNKANARLIAAAPEMLEVLQGFQKAWAENRLLTSDEAANIRAAIAKATGGAA